MHNLFNLIIFASVERWYMKFRKCAIDGLLICELKAFEDSRGLFREIFRTEWFEELFEHKIQMNCTVSAEGSLRGLHYHKKQTDIWIPITGRMTAGFADAREDSETFGKSLILPIDPGKTECVIIPPGIAHGYYAEVESMLIYVVNKYYDGTDEYGIAWDDPVLALDWNAAEPILSDRDRQNKPFNWW